MVESKRKEAMLRQNCCCALCGHVFNAAETTCCHKRTGVILCKSCSPVVVQIFAAIERFGGPQAFATRFSKLIQLAGLGNVALYTETTDEEDNNDQGPNPAYDELADSAAQAMLQYNAKEAPVRPVQPTVDNVATGKNWIKDDPYSDVNGAQR